MRPFLIKKFHPFLNKNNPTIVLHMVLVIHFNFLNFGKHLSSQLGAFFLINFNFFSFALLRFRPYFCRNQN